MVTRGNHFPIPYTYYIDVRVVNGIQMLLDCNFTRNNQGGLMIEGNTITLYKKTTVIQTGQSSHMALPELRMDENDYVMA